MWSALAFVFLGWLALLIGGAIYTTVGDFKASRRNDR